MELNTYKWMFIICALIFTPLYFLAKYIGKKNAERHPLQHLMPTKQVDFPPWVYLIFGGLMVIFSAKRLTVNQKFSEEWLLSIGFICFGLYSIWSFFRKSNKQKKQ